MNRHELLPLHAATPRAAARPCRLLQAATSHRPSMRCRLQASPLPAAPRVVSHRLTTFAPPRDSNTSHCWRLRATRSPCTAIRRWRRSTRWLHHEEMPLRRRPPAKLGKEEEKDRCLLCECVVDQFILTAYLQRLSKIMSESGSFCPCQHASSASRSRICIFFISYAHNCKLIDVFATIFMYID